MEEIKCYLSLIVDGLRFQLVNLKRKQVIWWIFRLTDEEGSEEYIVSYYDVIHIIIDRGEQPQYITYRSIDFMDITKAVIEDIKLYFEDLVRWSPYEDTEKDWNKRRTELKELILETESALAKEAERCNKRL